MANLIDIPIGSVVYGRQGNQYQVIGIDADRIILKFPNGTHKRVLRSIIHHWAPTSQKPLGQPKAIEVGDTVQLKGTGRTYRVLRLHPVYCGQGEYQDWAKLEGPCGAAHWLVGQLEIV